MDELFQEVNTDEVVTIDENADYLAELVGEGKKFKTPHDLARGKAEADRYIEVLKAKMADLEKEVNTRKSLEAFKTELEALKNPAPVETPIVSTPDTPQALDESRLESLLEQLLQKKEVQRARETNAQKVSRVLEENFGPKAQAVLNEKARELGMGLSELKGIAQTSPAAFFRLVGAQEGNSRPAPISGIPTGSVNVGAPESITARGKSYYEKLKREQPKLYNDPKVTSQMIQDMAKLGRERFYNS